MAETEANAARTLTRRINELRSLVQDDGASVDIEEKIAQVKKAFDDLGWAQDEIMELIDVTDKETLDGHSS